MQVFFFKLLNGEKNHKEDLIKIHRNSSVSNKFWATLFLGTGTDKTFGQPANKTVKQPFSLPHFLVSCFLQG
jgi:hypothetical protein